MKDDRTPAERETHTRLVAMRDTFMSGFGPGRPHGSTAAWACRLQDEERVYDWVEGRSDSSYVRQTTIQALRRLNGPVHIYVVNDGHPALGGVR